jgi:hypothetical protein
MEITLKNKCCLYTIIPISFFSITICNLLIDFPSYTTKMDNFLNNILDKYRPLSTRRVQTVNIHHVYADRETCYAYCGNTAVDLDPLPVSLARLTVVEPALFE